MNQFKTNRRAMLALTAAALGTQFVPFGRGAFAAATGTKQRLVVVMLRGAVDGLNVVVPYGEPAYYGARPTIAVPRPGAEGGALKLDDHFALHPALASLMPQWSDGTLAFVHASGSPDPTRSHFDAQDYMESGTPGRKSTSDGWMNRLLGRLPGTNGPTSALSFGPTLPRIFSGSTEVATVPLGQAAAASIPLDRPVINAAFDALYTGDDSLSRAYREGLQSHRKVMTELQADMAAADNGAPSPVSFGQDATHLARIVRQDPSVNLAFFALGGWDTHVNQGSSQGQLAQHLKPLSDGLATLARDLGPAYQDTVIVVMSEFGRTFHENGNRGTDHGHGNVMWVMGGPVAGGRIHGRWPGLSAGELHEGRDLAITSDFRSVIASVLTGHLKLQGDAVAAVLPDAPAAPALNAIIRA